MERRRRCSGTNTPDTLTSMANLAYTWKSQGRDKEAIDLVKKRKGCKEMFWALVILIQWVPRKLHTNGTTVIRFHKFTTRIARSFGKTRSSRYQPYVQQS